MTDLAARIRAQLDAILHDGVRCHLGTGYCRECHKAFPLPFPGRRLHQHDLVPQDPTRTGCTCDRDQRVAEAVARAIEKAAAYADLEGRQAPEGIEPHYRDAAVRALAEGSSPSSEQEST